VVKIGRPVKTLDSANDRMVMDRVITGLSAGTPLTVICSPSDMPCVNTIRSWADKDPPFAASIARAREAGFDQIALDALAIADCTANDTDYTKDGDEKPNSEWIARSRLRVDTRLKLLAKWDPKRYGEMLKAEVSGPNGGAIQIDQVKRDADAFTSAIASLAARAAEIGGDSEA
jgi:hypothetical protein